MLGRVGVVGRGRGRGGVVGRVGTVGIAHLRRVRVREREREGFFVDGELRIRFMVEMRLMY